VLLLVPFLPLLLLLPPLLLLPLLVLLLFRQPLSPNL